MTEQQTSPLRGRTTVLAASLLIGVSSLAAAQGNSSNQLRRFIGEQVGGIQKLMVAAKDTDLPQPRLPNGQPDPVFQITEAKRFLGKMLFHDPARMVRIHPEFGGIPVTSGSASCASCHQGESATKAGTLINFAAGGEGRHYTDEDGNFIPRRRPRLDILPRLRSTPLFPGDALVDELPTLTDIYELAVGSPARGRKLPPPGQLLRTGRLDALDSVARNAPGVIGAAYNNRLLMGGFAGEPDEAPGGLNPFQHPAQENVALLLLDAHRMLEEQSAVLKAIPAFVKLFKDAFPDEAAQAASSGNLDLLVNDVTAFRATATFLRTTMTRNTPWDRFIAGDNRALTAAQRRGASLFFTPARTGGAGCYTCHSGPAFNKQVADPDLGGVGALVEQNFYNLGLTDHPLQALNRAGRNDPNFRDDGRREVTGRDSDAFKFRVLGLRQLKDARFFFHNGSFTAVKDVVKYFNAGVPQDAEAAAAGTLTSRFTFPRGTGSDRGLGLNERQIDDLVDFIENGLYDPAFAHYDPDSSTQFFQLSPRDITYSVYRPDLAALGAVDGHTLSGKAEDNDDALSRRDMGLEFLDVTDRVRVSMIASHRHDDEADDDGGRSGDGRDDRDRDGRGNRRGRGGEEERTYRITNTGSGPVDTHLLVIANGLSYQVEMTNASGRTTLGFPYRRLFLSNGVLEPGQSIDVTMRFKRYRQSPPVNFTLTLLSGQGNP